MGRRVGYILGALFVVACAAAYPLTWGRDVAFSREIPSRRGQMEVGVYSGQFRCSVSGRSFAGAYGWIRIDDLERWGRPRAKHLLVAKHWSAPSHGGWGGGIYFPLWMPALPASMFMAWRWRRGRRRSAAGPGGFEVGKAGGRAAAGEAASSHS